MNREWLECLMEMPLSEYDDFKENSNLDVHLELSKKFDVVDYSWLSVVEKYLPFLKSTVESAIPLLENSLEAKKNYENRFLYTLLNRLNEFLEKQYKILLEQENASDKSILKINGITSSSRENVSIDLLLTVTKKEMEKKKDSTLQAKERLERVLSYLKPLINSEFITLLDGASVVRSPIRRTGLLETHDNYKKLLELFEFLDSYGMLEKAFANKEKERSKDTFLIPYFMNYQLLGESGIFTLKDEEFLKKYLEGIVRQLVEESSIDEKSFKKLLNKLFEEEYAKKKSREKNIAAIFTKSFDTYQKQAKDAIRSLKG